MKIKDIMQSKTSHSQRNDKYCMIHLYETLEVIGKIIETDSRGCQGW